jgi:hypothetical protein
MKPNRPPSLGTFRDFGDDLSAILVGVIVLAIVAVVVHSTGTADFIKSAGTLLAGLSKIVVGPGSPQK